jgi:hypothetical protein
MAIRKTNIFPIRTLHLECRTRIDEYKNPLPSPPPPQIARNNGASSLLRPPPLAHSLRANGRRPDWQGSRERSLSPAPAASPHCSAGAGASAPRDRRSRISQPSRPTATAAAEPQPLPRTVRPTTIRPLPTPSPCQTSLEGPLPSAAAEEAIAGPTPSATSRPTSTPRPPASQGEGSLSQRRGVEVKKNCDLFVFIRQTNIPTSVLRYLQYSRGQPYNIRWHPRSIVVDRLPLIIPRLIVPAEFP